MTLVNSNPIIVENSHNTFTVTVYVLFSWKVADGPGGAEFVPKYSSNKMI